MPDFNLKICHLDLGFDLTFVIGYLKLQSVLNVI